MPGAKEISVVPGNSTIGATVTGIDLAGDIDGDAAAAIRAALDEWGVLVFPAQVDVDDVAQQRVAGLWSEVAPHPVVAFLGGTEVMGVVFNNAEHPPGNGGDAMFHTDYSFNTEIPDVAVLRSVEVPPVGGATVWSDARAALKHLQDADPGLVAELCGLSALHDPGPRFAVELEVRLGAELTAKAVDRFGAGNHHPVVAVHPRTGDELLFVNAGYTRHIDGLARKRSDSLLQRLYNVFASPEITFEWRWQPGDVAIWDEHRTVHRGPTDFAPHARVLRRCTAGATRPAPASGVSWV